MEPHAPPSPATYAYHHHHHHQRSPDSIPHHDVDVCNEEDAYQQQYYARTERGSKGSSRRGHDSVISHPLSPKASSPPSLRSSFSSATGRKHNSISEIHQSPHASLSYPARAYLDPEKAILSPHSSQPNQIASSKSTDKAIVYDSGRYTEKGPEDKATKLLLFLSGPCAFLSFLITIWTMILLVAALLLQPLRLCTARKSLSSQITASLSPPLNLQLHLIYSHSAATEYSSAMLVVVHLFAPIVAIGVAIAAWTAAFFWFFSAILGDPAGQDGHNDGKETLLVVRNWWDRWLSRALRPQTTHEPQLNEED